MPADSTCELAQLELSSAHDEDRAPSADVLRHVATCEDCTAFQRSLPGLDRLLADGEFSQAPDLVIPVIHDLSRPRRQWWAVAAVAVVGIAIGALVGGIGTRLDIVRAQDLNQLFHRASTSLNGLSAEVLVVERGWHPAVPERVYTGSLEYTAPGQLAIRLVDTTAYPDDAWTPNDVLLEIADGDLVSVASSPCPVAALPDCQKPPSTVALSDQRPFDEGVLVPLEIVGPGRSLSQWSGIEVVGAPTLQGRPTLQVQTTVAAVDLMKAITDRGAWRDLHPTDDVLMWLDEETLVPLRIEVTPAGSAERELWQLRHGYTDPGGEPILIVELTEVVTEPALVRVEIPEGSPSQGFIDGPVDLPEPVLGTGFQPHRSGVWPLPDGGEVELASWSDGRSWVRVEVTDSWAEPRLFGLSTPFARPIDLGAGSIGYLGPTGTALAIHTEDVEILLSGSVPEEVLIEAGRSLGLPGLAVPDDWIEASVIPVDQLPSGTLVPDDDGWSILGRLEDDETTLLLAGGGSRTVLITQEPGSRLGPPTGPDFSAVDVRDTTGRYDSSAATLEWVEDGRVIGMRSETVSLGELVDMARSMTAR